MAILIHPHAEKRLIERGATKDEVSETVAGGESSPARLGRVRFRKNFVYNDYWRDKNYSLKQVEVIAVMKGDDWLVLTVVTRFF
ncbi:MAG: DUF4258 domain-containing protein [bacterium]|nr:DUF4258 domain-containing protein [bacterium]